MKQHERINLRLSEELRTRLRAACKLTGMDELTLLRTLVEAYVERVEEDGGIFLPLRVVSGASAKKNVYPRTDSTPSLNETSGLKAPTDAAPRTAEAPTAVMPPPSQPHS